MVQGAGAAGKGLEISSSALVKDKEQGGAATEPKFGEIWKQIQSNYGARPEKPREIKKTLGKDDFLRIMITQMRHQDPTEPFSAEKLASEMAQFTSVEQLQNLNRSMEKMSENNRPLERLAMTNLIGKTVIMDRDRFLHSAGSNEYLGFALPEEASAVRISIVSADTGETVLEKDLGPLKAGENGFYWDGKKANSLPALSGNYFYRVSAQGKSGQSLHVGSQAQARVVGVSFDGNEPVLLVGDSANPSRIQMSNITRIIEGAGEAGNGKMIPGARSLSEASVGGQSGGVKPIHSPGSNGGPNFFTFEKGVGSKTLDESKLNPETLAALKKYRAEIAEKGEQISDSEKGFPNGLSGE